MLSNKYLWTFIIIFTLLYLCKDSRKIYETFKNNIDLDNLDSVIDGGDICSKHISKPMKLHETCQTLSSKSCNATSCCIWLNGKSCVAGDSSGPTFRTNKGKKIEVDYYSYQNKEFGNK